MHALTQLLEHLAMKAYLQKSQWHAVLTLNVSINFTKRRAARYVGRANMWLGWRYYRKGNHSLSLKYTFNHVISCFLFCALGDLIKHPLVCVQFFFNQHDSSMLTRTRRNNSPLWVVIHLSSDLIYLSRTRKGVIDWTFSCKVKQRWSHVKGNVK